MQEVLAISLQSMQLDMQRLDRIGANIANALTPGYKREVASSAPMGANGMSFATMAHQLSAKSAASDQAPSLPQAVQLTIESDVRPGTLKSTGRSLDLALAGPGYFEVSTDSGPAYTRQGSLHVDPRGRLVTAQGYPVMGKGGEIYLNDSSPVIDAAGNVYQSQGPISAPSLAGGGRIAVDGGGPSGSGSIAQLKVVQIGDAKTAQRLGEGLISTKSGPDILKDSDIQIRQGFLENSNVNSMQEMVQLMQTMRHFESVQKAAIGYDEMMGQAIRKLGELS
jgi:flagellar basal-body rod protein FlgG